jgi:hypothetical protein
MGGVGPAALLGATDGDPGLGNFFDQDRGVEDAVLFGAGEFFTVNEQDRLVGAVDEHQLGDRAGGRDFLSFRRSDFARCCVSPRAPPRPALEPSVSNFTCQPAPGGLTFMVKPAQPRRLYLARFSVTLCNGFPRKLAV